MAGFNLLKLLQHFQSAACRIWGTLEWQAVGRGISSLPFINIPRHSLRSSHFTLGSWFVWAFIWLKKNNSLIMCQVMYFLHFSSCLYRKNVYLKDSRQEDVHMCRIFTCMLTEHQGFQGIKNLPTGKINVDLYRWNTHTQIRMKNPISNFLQIPFQVPAIIITLTINPTCSFWLLMTQSPTQRWENKGTRIGVLRCQS